MNYCVIIQRHSICLMVDWSIDHNKKKLWNIIDFDSPGLRTDCDK